MINYPRFNSFVFYNDTTNLQTLNDIDASLQKLLSGNYSNESEMTRVIIPMREIWPFFV